MDDDSSKRAYAAVYFEFLNSSSPGALLVNAIFRAVHAREFGRARTVLQRVRHFAGDPFIVAFTLLLLPGAWLSVVMGVYYPHVTLLCLVPTLGAVWLARRYHPPRRFKDDRVATAKALTARLLLRFVATVSVVSWIATLYNYGVLTFFVPYKSSYMGVAQTEWESRSVECILRAMSDSGSDAFRRATMIVS